MIDNHEWSNELFRFGWLETKLADACLSTLAGIADRLRGLGAFELDTIAIFVEPLLRGLGWETLDHNQVDRAPAGPHADFELWSDGAIKKRVVVIEVEPLDALDRHLREHAYEQVCGYVANPERPDDVLRLEGEAYVYGAVTNGKSWRVYEFHGEQQELKCEFDLRDNPDVPTFVDTLGRRQLLRRLNL